MQVGTLFNLVLMRSSKGFLKNYGKSMSTITDYEASCDVRDNGIDLVLQNSY